MRTMLSCSIIVVFVAGLLAVIYAMRPGVPVGSAPPSTQPASAREPRPTAGTRPEILTSPTSPVSNGLVANTTKPSSPGSRRATERADDPKASGDNARFVPLFFLLRGYHRPPLP